MIAPALRRNGGDRLITIDVEPSAEAFPSETARDFATQAMMDSVACIQGLSEPIDVLILDFNHPGEHERNAPVPSMSMGRSSETARRLAQ